MSEWWVEESEGEGERMGQNNPEWSPIANSHCSSELTACPVRDAPPLTGRVLISTFSFIFCCLFYVEIYRQLIWHYLLIK